MSYIPMQLLKLRRRIESALRILDSCGRDERAIRLKEKHFEKVRLAGRWTWRCSRRRARR